MVEIRRRNLRPCSPPATTAASASRPGDSAHSSFRRPDRFGSAATRKLAGRALGWASASQHGHTGLPQLASVAASWVGQALGGRSLLLFWSSASQYFLTSRSKGATTTFGSSLDAALVSARSRRTSNRPLQVKPVANLDARAARRDDPYMRRLVATLLIGMGLVGAVYLSSLKLGAVVYLPSGVHCRYLAPHACGGLLPSPVPPIRSSPAWQLPVSLLIGVLGIAGGLLVMRQPAAVSDPAV